MRAGFPLATTGQVIGLLGGSFDPAHEGHAHITREALKRFGLDAVWWLVTPGNPLKANGPASLPERMARARAVMQHPRVKVTDLEAHLGTRYTARTLAKLRRIYPGVRFVWLMGADNLVQFHRWQDWQGIMAGCPVGVLSRPNQRLAARFSKAATIAEKARVREARALRRAACPAWCMVDMPMRRISSSELRAKGAWPK